MALLGRWSTIDAVFALERYRRAECENARDRVALERGHVGRSILSKLQIDAAAGRWRPLHAVGQPRHGCDRRGHRQDALDLRAPARDIGGRGATGATLAGLLDRRDVKRLFHNSSDGRLIAVDAKTGKAAAGFGKKGAINLRSNSRGPRGTDVGSVSPALVVGDIVVVQIIVGGGRNKESAPGYIRGYDVRTGKEVWRFNPCRSRASRRRDLGERSSTTRAAGAWSMMSADPETG